MELQGKNVLITGGAKRLGRAMAIALAEKGANVAIHFNRSKKDAEELASQLEAMGTKAISVSADCHKPKKIEKAVLKTADELGTIDILINNAAIFYRTPINNIDKDNWDDFLDVNLKAYFFFAREFAKLAGNNLRKIINMADVYAHSPAKDFIPYGVSKAGVVALTKGLAKAYAPDILVNTISPGVIMPPANSNSVSLKENEKVINQTLLKGAGTPEDITKTVIFLAENDYITGSEIFVDGGRHIT